MERHRGFTLIEILVTITIMVILMTLGVASLRGTQVRARDEDRRNDAENITRHLDSQYAKGYSFPFDSTTVTQRGSYPTTAQFTDSAARAAIFEYLPAAVLIAPNNTNSDDSIFAAINDIETTSGVLPSPEANGAYVYQPISDVAIANPEGSPATTKLCIDYLLQTCRRFNLYYHSETTGAIYVIKSRDR